VSAGQEVELGDGLADLKLAKVRQSLAQGGDGVETNEWRFG